jgi:hypothetical protein
MSKNQCFRLHKHWALVILSGDHTRMIRNHITKYRFVHHRQDCGRHNHVWADDFDKITNCTKCGSKIPKAVKALALAKASMNKVTI